MERLEKKTTAIRFALLNNEGDWAETFYQIVARNFGLKINAEPFEALARSMPQIYLARHKDNLFQIEALLFGQAGMLQKEFAEDYPRRLKKEYFFLKTKYQLEPLDPSMWKFLRLHPANFPTVRLAQFAQLFYRANSLFSKILKAENQEEVEALFRVKLEGYWLTHYTFDKESPRKNKSFGKQAIRLLTINAIAPFLFLYGQEKGDETFKDRALKLLEELPPEKNKIIKGWENLGMLAGSAYRTQALLQLKNEYCNKKRCLECSIGGAILK